MTRREPEWLEVEVIVLLHDLAVERHGGLPGVRDDGALRSALARPVNKFAYGDADIASLGAAYGFGLARNHAFADGNKRIAFVAMELFLAVNGLRLIASESEKIDTVLALAAGDLSEDALADWLRAQSRPA